MHRWQNIYPAQQLIATVTRVHFYNPTTNYETVKKSTPVNVNGQLFKHEDSLR